MQLRKAEARATTDSWDDFLASKRPDVGYVQSSWWADLQTTCGWSHFSVIVRDGEDVLGGARILSRHIDDKRCFYYVPEGPILPADEDDAKQVLEAFLAHVDGRRKRLGQQVTHLRLEPRWASVPACLAGHHQAGSWHEPRDTLLVDLALSDDELLAQMKSKGRYNIGVARRHGVTIVADDSDAGIDQFLAIHQETVTRHSLNAQHADYYRSLSVNLRASGRGTLLFAQHEQQRLAVAMIVYSGDRATYLFGGSRPSARHLMAPYLLHFEAMRLAKARGHRWYDFYGIAPSDASTHPWADITTFKRKFGGIAKAFVPSLDIIYDQAGYDRYRAARAG